RTRSRPGWSTSVCCSWCPSSWEPASTRCPPTCGWIWSYSSSAASPTAPSTCATALAADRTPAPGLAQRQVRVLILDHRAVALKDRLGDRNQRQRGANVAARLDAAAGDREGHVLLALEVAVG